MGKDFDFDAIGKRTPFRTPEGFFENVRTDILMRAEAEKRAKKFRRLRWGISIALAAAAIWCGFFFFPGGQTKPEPLAAETEWMAQLTDGTDVMDLYLQDLTDEELEEWMDFSENDIFYELTTQNLNEDED